MHEQNLIQSILGGRKRQLRPNSLPDFLEGIPQEGACILELATQDAVSLGMKQADFPYEMRGAALRLAELIMKGKAESCGGRQYHRKPPPPNSMADKA